MIKSENSIVLDLDFSFANKSVLIVSPQDWSHIKVSKHHYADTLMEMGAEVYFLGPPKSGRGINIETTENGVKLIQLGLNFPYELRFHLPTLFDFLIKWRVRKMLSTLNLNIDVLWCFEPNIYADLSIFKSKIKIYHPVDPIDQNRQKKVGQSADLILSVSDKILDSIPDTGIPRGIINHGISKDFEPKLESLNKESYSKPDRPKIGYVGNLLRPAIDRVIFDDIVRSNDDCEFHLWGPNLNTEKNVGREVDMETSNFLKKLESYSNVVFEGIRLPKELAQEIKNMDAFFLFYKFIPGYSDRSNSHKILEYLSTGKVLISCRISSYIDADPMIVMPPSDDDYVLPELFKKSISNLTFLNSKELQEKRMKLALENTYGSQVLRIQTLLQQSVH